MPWVFLGRVQFLQAQRCIGLGPGAKAGLSHPAPPHLVFEAPGPSRMRLGQPNQPVAGVFFRAYSGSGLVIHCLARRQPMPSRSRVARTVSALTNSAVSPCADETSAAKASVHRLVGWPKLRGLWGARRGNLLA